jgi:hypothetical protein
MISSSIFLSPGSVPDVQKRKEHEQRKTQMQEEIRRCVIKALGVGFLMGGAFMYFLYSGVIIPVASALR